MEYRMDDNIIAKTKNCGYNFACLNVEDYPLCKVTDCIDCEIHFVEKTETYCHYILHFGDAFICTCPVRNELHRLYKI